MEPITNQTVQQTPPKKKSLSQWAIARKKFIRNMPAMASLIFLLVVTALSIASPLLSDIDPSRINPRLVEAPPSAEH
ncbi:MULTISPECIES: hypothetical protein [Clostridia]|uniref:hypothetical protein n=1 Tax=Clostridia TaxID=186801 RepID=UPI0018F4E871|nr:MULTISPECIES: hypothetical protein [Clostridia]